MTTPSLGVIIARFQVPELHEGHRHLIETVLALHPRTLVLLGCTDAVPTTRNPLSFTQRRLMLQEAYPSLIVEPLYDCQSDAQWTQRVDSIVLSYARRDQAVLYGSRDSFVTHYTGSFATSNIPAIPAPTGTEMREALRAETSSSADFRKGVITASLERFPIVYPTVDVAVVDHRRSAVLLAEKPGLDGLCFIGGFVSPSDKFMEAAMLRELSEEAGAPFMHHVSDPRVIGTCRIDDARYKGTDDAVMTTFFRLSLEDTEIARTTAQPHDDISALHWVPLSSLLEQIAPGHKPLAEMLLAYNATEFTLNKDEFARAQCQIYPRD